MITLQKKYTYLKNILASMKSVLLAYSGGVDSTFLLKVAHDVLRRNILAVTADSPTLPREELKFAAEMAKQLKVKHLVIETDEMRNKNFIKNDRDRCYWCKKDLFSKLNQIKEKENINCVLDGSNSDDRSDWRPGSLAAKELGVRSPLKEAKLTKDEIRRLSKRLSLPTWNKPQQACLSSRVPYGTKISKITLTKIENAEDILHKLGFTQVRVRSYGAIARIEVPKENITKLVNMAKQDGFLDVFKKIGYRYVTVDLEGYRSGSMNIM